MKAVRIGFWAASIIGWVRVCVYTDETNNPQIVVSDETKNPICESDSQICLY